MKFVTVRELRSNLSQVRKDLEKEREIIITSNGKPFAVLTPVDPDSVEEELASVRQARAKLAIDRIRESARAKGLDKMSMNDIDKLIARTRRERGKPR